MRCAVARNGLAGKARANEKYERNAGVMRTLLEAYPGLREPLPLERFATLPTPVARVPGFESLLGAASFHVKRDDLTALEYGGNKVRKLEFLLGRARCDGCRAVMTFGGAGSNHALATAIYARRLGMDAISMLVPQPNAPAVRRNLLMSLTVGAELHLCPDKDRLDAAVASVVDRRRRSDGRPPMIIPPGGSSPIGALGYVNAALELHAQADAGDLPAPDVIYLAAGTLGTGVGLALGLQAAQMHASVMAIRVTEPSLASEAKARALYEETNHLLHRHDASFPLSGFPGEHFALRHEFFGPGYGVITPEVEEAIRAIRDAAGLALDHTYTGKALSAVMADAARLRGKHVLFLNTYNSRDLDGTVAGIDYRALPREFHPYFEGALETPDTAKPGAPPESI